MASWVGKLEKNISLRIVVKMNVIGWVRILLNESSDEWFFFFFLETFVKVPRALVIFVFVDFGVSSLLWTKNAWAETQWALIESYQLLWDLTGQSEDAIVNFIDGHLAAESTRESFHFVFFLFLMIRQKPFLERAG